MRRRRALILLGGIVLAIWMVWGDHGGNHSRRHVQRARPDLAFFAPPMTGDRGAPTRTIDAPVLTIDIACAETITLEPMPGLGDRVIASLRERQNDAALNSLVADHGGLRQPAGCAGIDPADFVLQVDSAKEIHILQRADVAVRGGRFLGQVFIDGSGSGDVVLEAVGGLQDHHRGSGDVTIGTVNGPVEAGISGSGDLSIRSGVISTATLGMNEGGDVDLGRATVGNLQAHLGGSGDLTVGDVTGPIVAETDGSGDIVIDNAISDRAQLTGRGSGDISVGAGRIESLVGDRHGSGDLTVEAVIGNAVMIHNGSGDVNLPHVTHHTVTTD